MTKRRSYKKDFEQADAQRQQLEQEVKLLREQGDIQRQHYERLDALLDKQLDTQKAEPPSTQERWLKRNIITLEVIGIIIAISSTILAFFVYQQTQKQTDFLGNQTAIMAHQDTLIQNQNDLFEQQNTKVDTQNNLIRLQNENLNLQNELFQKQNTKLDTQNDLFQNQNERLDVQIALSEADRRSALIFLMSNIMDKVDDELKTDWNKDSIRNISPQLIARIAALSQAMNPYRYLKDSVLIERPLSPERGQLLTALVKTKFDFIAYRDIYLNVKFQDADLQNAQLDSADLSWANLNGANLIGANLWRAELRGAELRGAELVGANLISAKLISANLNGANLISADLSEAKLWEAEVNGAKLSGAELSEADLWGADLWETDLSGAKLSGAELNGTYLISADLSEAKNITFEQLSNSISLYKCQGIPDTLLTRLREEKPKLFEKPDWWDEWIEFKNSQDN